MRRLFERSAYLPGFGALLALLLAVATYLLSLAKAIDYAVDAVRGDGWRGSVVTAQILEVVDLLLVGTVLVITAIGLWELFVGPLEVPDWLKVSSLDDLKGKIADVVLLVLVIKFVEKFVVSKDALDTLWLALSVLAVGVVLVGYRLRR